MADAWGSGTVRLAADPSRVAPVGQEPEGRSRVGIECGVCGAPKRHALGAKSREPRLAARTLPCPRACTPVPRRSCVSVTGEAGEGSRPPPNPGRQCLMPVVVYRVAGRERETRVVKLWGQSGGVVLLKRAPGRCRPWVVVARRVEGPWVRAGTGKMSRRGLLSLPHFFAPLAAWTRPRSACKVRMHRDLEDEALRRSGWSRFGT